MNNVVTKRTIAITGASRGIGRACALALASPDVTLLLIGNTGVGLFDTATECRDKGAAAHCFAIDLSRTDELEQRVCAIQDELGPIHTLINNAGMWIESPFTQGNMTLWDRALDVNLNAAIHLTRYMLEGMPAGGAVVFIGSTASKKTYAGGTNYCAAKFGLLGFAGALFEDVRERGIKVCSILPGVVNTDMHAGEPFDQDKMIQPEDIAATVVFVLDTPPNVCPTEIVIQPQRYPKNK
jgi:NADP-dependent 3-hydroxy acid dehydrogenase YdfG